LDDAEDVEDAQGKEEHGEHRGDLAFGTRNRMHVEV
jgi:hypothetical protein